MDPDYTEDDWTLVEGIANVAGELGNKAQQSTAHPSGLRKAAAAAFMAYSLFRYGDCFKAQSFEENSSVLCELNTVVSPSDVRIHHFSELNLTRLTPWVIGNTSDH